MVLHHQPSSAPSGGDSDVINAYQPPFSNTPPPQHIPYQSLDFLFFCFLFFILVTDQRWWVATWWWLLAIDDIGNLLLVAPAKVDGGGGGLVVWLVGCGGGPVGGLGLFEILFILESWSKKC